MTHAASISLPLRVAVCDDESMARKRALRLLGEQADVEEAHECEGPAELQRLLDTHDIDVVLLDINMPGMTGLEFARTLAEPRPHIVFLTAHAEHAVDAFEVGATDYLVKPIDNERLRRALDRAKKAIDTPSMSERGRPAEVTSLPRLAIATRDGATLLSPADVTHCTFDGQLVTVHTKDRAVLCDLSLQDLEQKLPHLERVHRRSLVALAHVDRLEDLPSGGYSAHFASGKTAEVSRKCARSLRRKLGIG